ncbi:flagellar filament capping protein FliD [Leptothrix discophora]|uniref:Flagellar hook-associated protein 2 n=1 Tax=Leptothrix discophora TaxID=89 RepID=A0ABT9G708_LEPDI|nr:flagellar filament capping protein FliD [Leptothrix discophora]MDP4302042.1 flagellar filament capping protein FliD [Leptothrix discophora]
MSSISSAGIGSGLDVNSIVTQLMAVEKAPLQQMQTATSKIQNQLSAYGKIQSFVSTLRDASSKLTSATTWNDTTATSGDSSVFTATTDGTAQAGNYTLSVQQLATAQTVASPASAFPVGAGVLRIQDGAGGQAIDVAIGAGDSPAQVRDKINAAKAGVVASVVTDASGSRLLLRASETGADHAFTVREVVSDGMGGETTTTTGDLAKLTYDSSQPAAAGVNMSLTQAAGNAKAKVNGLDVESASNLLTGAVEGVTIKLGKVSASPVELSVTNDTESIKTAISAFADAYNQLNTYLSQQTAYDATTKKAGTLQGDSATNSLQYAMRGIASGTGTMAGSYQRLAQIGIEIKKDGSMSINDTKLTGALGAQLGDVKALFASKDTATASNNGFGVRLQQWGDALLKFDGALTSRSESLQRKVDAGTKSQDAFNDRMTQVEARLRKQYTALDNQMSKLTSLQAYVTQQVTSWNKSTG